jgi:hypothetical protein
MKIASIYRAPLRMRLPGAAQHALYAGIARGLRDASMGEARETTNEFIRQYLVNRARGEHKSMLTYLRLARAAAERDAAIIERAGLWPLPQAGERIAARNAARYSQHPKDISGEWPF